jgi:hypothetical protein
MRQAWARYKGAFPLFWTLLMIPAIIQIFAGIGSLPPANAAKDYQAPWPWGVVALIGGLLLSLATPSIQLILAGRGKETPMESFLAGVRVWPAVLWAGILSALSALGGMFLFFVPGVIASLRLQFTSYTVVLDNKRGRAATTSSWNIVYGRTSTLLVRGAVAGFMLLGVFLLAQIVGFAVGAFAGAAVQVAIVLAATDLVIFPLWTAFLMELYFFMKQGVVEESFEPKSLAVYRGIGIIVAVLLVVAMVVLVGWAVTHPSPSDLPQPVAIN